MILWECCPFVIGEKRNQCFRAHIHEDHTRGFLAWVSGVVDLGLQCAAGWLRWRFKDIAVDIVLPTMVNASQTALLIPTVVERCTSVRAMLTHKPHARFTIPERHQVFA